MLTLPVNLTELFVGSFDGIKCCELWRTEVIISVIYIAKGPFDVYYLFLYLTSEEDEGDDAIHRTQRYGECFRRGEREGDLLTSSEPF